MGLEVMDTAAVSLCKENKLPIIVLNIEEKGSVSSAIQGNQIGTLVS
jgi:uridylate kinase